MLDGYKELTPVVYGESSIKYLYCEAEPERLCFNMHWHDRMELLLVISGSLMLHSDEGHFEVRPGQVVVTSPKKMHGGFAGSEGVIYHTIMFDIERFYNATSVSEKYLVPIVKGDISFPRVISDKCLEKALSRLVEHLTGKVNSHPLVAEADIYEILGVLYGYSLFSAKSVADMNKGFNLILEYVNTHFTEKITPREISLQFGYNEAYFCRRFKEVTGLTFTQYVQALRMEYGIKLLRAGKEEIRYIAWKCGYSDVSYFSNCFKRCFGVRPSEIYGKRE